MKFVQTVLGKIPADTLGNTDAHEHLIRMGGGEVIHGGKDFLMDSYEAALNEVALFQQAGGKTVVEMTPCGSGRDIGSLVEISKASGVQVIATTGFHKSVFYDPTHFIYRYSVEEIARLLIEDVEEGIDLYDYAGPIVKRSNAKAGVIKAAANYQVITAVEQKVLQAAGKASVATGYPVSLHTERGTMALEIIDILLAEGVRPDNIILGHIDRNPDLFYHEQLAAKGVYLIYDGPGRIKYYPDEVIATLIKNMVDRGWGSQLLIGADLGRRSYFKSYQGGPGMDYNLQVFWPRIRAAGVPEEVIQKIYSGNAAQAFANKQQEL